MTEKRTIRILSAGAVKEGLRKNAELFSAETGVGHEIEFLPGPAIVERVLAGKAEVDLTIVPHPLFDALIAERRVRRDDVAVLGCVTVGVTIRDGAHEPDLGSVDAFVASVLGADRVIHNRASSGQYVAKVLDELGLTTKIGDRISIFPDGKTTMEALAADISGNAIGFGHATEIRLHDYLGTRLVGPLPGEIGRQTPYAAGLLADAGDNETGRALIDFMVSARGRQVFLDSGVLPAG
jgi:ABC-type molybdate transport system substrate-binding protein